jgi:hypothetical protein
MTGEAIPDAIEPLIGWRYWRLSHRSGRLRSLTGLGPEWEPRRALSARCRFSSYDPTDRRFQMVGGFTRRAHRSPGEKCTCGIYAARDLGHLRGQLLIGFTPMVVGEVELWGKVVPGAHGFRAEFAYPKSLHLITRIADGARTERSLEALAVYEVPVEVLNVVHAGVRPGFIFANAAKGIAAALRSLVPQAGSGSARA